MPSASSTSSTRRRIASCENPEVLEHEREVALDVVDDELRLGILRDEADDVGELAWVVRARRPAEDLDVAAEAPAARVRDEPVRGAQQRALARPRRADDEQELARRDLEVDVEQRRTPARPGTRTTRRGTRPRSRLHRWTEQHRHEQREQRERGQHVERRPGQRVGEPHEAAVARDRHRSPSRSARAPRPPATSQSARRMRRGRYRTRWVPDDARRIATPRPAAPDEPEHRRRGVGAADERDERAAEREQRRDAAPPGGPVARAGAAAREAARVHRLGQGDRAFQPELEHGHDLAQQSTAPHDATAGTGPVGVAHVVDRRQRRRHERERRRRRPGRPRRRRAASTARARQCETTELNAPNTPITPTIANPSASDCSMIGSSTVPPTVNPPSSRGSAKWGVVKRMSPTPWVVATVSSMRTTANSTPTASSSGNARAYGPGRGVDRHRDRRDPDHERDVDRARRELDARRRGERPHQPDPACQVGGAVVAVPGRGGRVGGRRTAGLRGGRHVGLTCPLDNGCAQPGCCVRFPGFGSGDGGSRCETDADPQL